MSELENIAIARVQASGRDIIARLRGDMEALHRRHAVEGMGGRTIIESQALCDRALEEQGNAITMHFKWVIEEGLWTPKPLVEDFTRRARDQLTPVLDASRELMHLATNRAESPQLLPRYLAELDDVRDRVWSNIDLSLRAAYAQRKRRTIRGFLASIVNLFAKILSYVRGG